MDNRRLLLTSDEVVMEGATLYDSSTYNGEAIEWIYVPLHVKGDVYLEFTGDTIPPSGDKTRTMYYKSNCTSALSWVTLGSVSGEDDTVRIKSSTKGEYVINVLGTSNYIRLYPSGSLGDSGIAKYMPGLFLPKETDYEAWLRLYVGHNAFKLTINNTSWDSLKIRSVTSNDSIYYKPYSA